MNNPAPASPISNDVQRYACVYWKGAGSHHVVEDPNGEYVKYEDYEFEAEYRRVAHVAAAQRDVLFDALRVARKELRLANLTEDGSQKENTSISITLRTIDAALATVAA